MITVFNQWLFICCLEWKFQGTSFRHGASKSQCATTCHGRRSQISGRSPSNFVWFVPKLDLKTKTNIFLQLASKIRFGWFFFLKWTWIHRVGSGKLNAFRTASSKRRQLSLRGRLEKLDTIFRAKTGEWLGEETPKFFTPQHNPCHSSCTTCSTMESFWQKKLGNLVQFRIVWEWNWWDESAAFRFLCVHLWKLVVNGLQWTWELPRWQMWIIQVIEGDLTHGCTNNIKWLVTVTVCNCYIFFWYTMWTSLNCRERTWDSLVAKLRWSPTCFLVTSGALMFQVIPGPYMAICSRTSKHASWKKHHQRSATKCRPQVT